MHCVLTLPTPDFTVNPPLGPPSSAKKPWSGTGRGSGTSKLTQSLNADAITVVPMRVKLYSFQHVIRAASRTAGVLSADAAPAASPLNAATAARPAVTRARRRRGRGVMDMVDLPLSKWGIGNDDGDARTGRRHPWTGTEQTPALAFTASSADVQPTSKTARRRRRQARSNGDHRPRRPTGRPNRA